MRGQFLKEEMSHLRMISWGLSLGHQVRQEPGVIFHHETGECLELMHTIHYRHPWRLEQPSGKIIHISQVTNVLIHSRSAISVLGKVPLETTSLKVSDTFIKMPTPERHCSGTSN